MARQADGGYSMVEVLLVLAVVGILMALVGPRFERMLAHTRAAGALNRVAADLAYTRHMAVRTGGRARLVIEPSGDCPAPLKGAAGHRYRIFAGPDSLVYLVDLRLDGSRVCLTSNQSGEVAFNSRGLVVGFNNRTISVRQGDHEPVFLTLSAVGRVLRQ